MKHLKRIVLAFTLCSSVLPAAIINVPVDINSIQGGINLASPGDTVLVQPGIYIENINFNGKNIVVGSLTLTTGDTSFISQTKIDGNGTGEVVLFENGEDSTAIICGFTITNGNRGISVYDSSPFISKINIYNNGRIGAGGGMYFRNSFSKIVSVSVIANSTGKRWGMASGGGIYCENSDIFLSNVTIKNNFSKGWGGGIYCESSNPVIQNTYIFSNIAHDPDYEDNSIGGGIFLSNSNPILVNVEISDNHANSAGGISCSSSNPIIINGTLVKNSGGSNPNVIMCWGSNLHLFNTIIWDNFESIYLSETSNLIILHSDIQGGIDSVLSSTDTSSTVNWLSGNVNTDPLFADTAIGDYRLKAGSPCIDAGIQDTMIIYNNGQDTLLVPPIPYLGSAPDMGAYEFDPTVAIPIESKEKIPHAFTLSQNYPNPFNPKTNIEFSIPKSEFVTLKVYNILGEEVATLVSERLTAGQYRYDWNAGSLASGVYLYRIQAGNHVESRKMVLLR